MELKIVNLQLKNFKGIKDLEINFNTKNTNIYGANATGKTTIFDAFKWLLFNKDSSDKETFNIKTLDKNNTTIHHLEHEVSATITIDGKETKLRKVLKEKWVKKRGELEEQYTGDITDYYIDDVPTKKTDYDAKIDEIIHTDIFKILVDPNYFNKLDKPQKRNMLVELMDNSITDEEILNENEQFKELKDNLENRSIEDYKKIVDERIKKLTKDKQDIPARIDEVNRTLTTNDNVDYDKLENDKQELNKQLQDIENTMIDVKKSTQKNMELVDKLTAEKKQFEEYKLNAETEAKRDITSKKIELENSKTTIENKIKNGKLQIESLEKSIADDNSRKEELYKKWDEVIHRSFEIDSDKLICPTCKREYETSKKEEIENELKNNFFENQEKEKASINDEGQALKKKIEENTKALNETKFMVETCGNELQVVNYDLDAIIQKENEFNFDVTSLPEYAEREKKINELEEQVNNLTYNNLSTYQSQKLVIQSQINDIDKQLNIKEQQQQARERIAELEKEEESISQMIQQYEKQQYLIEEFTKMKISKLENSINDKFKLAKFRLFDIQKNGAMRECCDALVNGVPYDDVNNAHRVLAGLDIINTFSKFYNVITPIFIDNRESINSINNILEMNPQVISLIVTLDKNLRIEEEK